MLYYPPLTFRSLEQSEMRTLFLAISLLLASTCVVRAGDESVLWWMFDETTEISDINGIGVTYIDTLVGRGDAAGKTVNAIRIGAYDGDTLLGYLAINDGGPGGGNNLPYYSMPTEDFDTGGESWNAGPTYAVLGDYATTPGVSFMIELGNWDKNGDSWTILAHSDPGTMDSLDEFMDVADFDMHTTLEWTGGSYSVPEPSSGLLMLIGAGFLALRRRRSAA